MLWNLPQVVTVLEETTFTDLEGLLIEETGRLPVIDRNGTLLGLVTRTDVLRVHGLYGKELNRRVN